MYRRLSEIWNENDTLIQRLSTLRVEERTVILALISQKKCPIVRLNFNDVMQTIDWYSHSVRLAKKPYLLMKILWTAKNHRATISKIEGSVWQTKTKKGFIERHTICTLINRTQKKLAEAAFPYKIKTLKIKIKNGSQPQIKGWKLVCAQHTKKY
jgi:DNA-binding response OmpR family regulator